MYALQAPAPRDLHLCCILPTLQLPDTLLNSNACKELHHNQDPTCTWCWVGGGAGRGGGGSCCCLVLCARLTLAFP